jgi:hypothetical protein
MALSDLDGLVVAWSGEDEAATCRTTERDRRPRAGSVRLSAPSRPCPGCPFCKRARVQTTLAAAARRRSSRQAATSTKRNDG